MKTPKRTRGDSWYNYYAGYSESFVADVCQSIDVKNKSLVVDPWNGSGTTTYVARNLGISSIGYDLNPSMVVVARSRQLGSDVLGSLQSICREIVACADELEDEMPSEPLAVWLYPKSAAALRKFDLAIRYILVDEKKNEIGTIGFVDALSSLACFFYVALFRAFRKVLRQFQSSNPTWIKLPQHPSQRLRPTVEQLQVLFSNEVEVLSKQLRPSCSDCQTFTSIGVADSRLLPLDSGVADAVVTSPPYCTRLDYVVATLPELAVLGFDVRDGVGGFRERMLGTPTIERTKSEKVAYGSATLELFLGKVSKHSAKASSSYYLKTFEQYFRGLEKSINEVGRILKPGGHFVVVVQDSYYKELHLDLQTIFSEVCATKGMVLNRREDFGVPQNMARIHPHSKQYRKDSVATESALFLIKEA